MAKYVEILFRNRLRFLILLFILPTELAAACVFLFPHQTAVSSLWVDTSTYIPIPSANQYVTPAQNTVDVLDQLRSTDSFVRTLGGKLDSMNTFANAAERNSVLATVTTDVVVTASGSHLVVLTYTCLHEPVCTNVLSGTVQIYEQWLADQETAQAKVAIDFYTGQLATAQSKLTSDETALRDYYASHPGVKVTDAPLIPGFDQLIRNVAIDKDAVAGFQQKLDSIRLADAATGQVDSTVLKVIDQPRVVGGRLSALPRKQMAIAGIVGVALAVAVLVIMAWSDRTTREPKELESLLRLPVVVTIPDLALMGAADG